MLDGLSMMLYPLSWAQTYWIEKEVAAVPPNQTWC